jgi:hypothetical protein
MGHPAILLRWDCALRRQKPEHRNDPNETIVRRLGLIIGKLDRDQRSGVRDQKKNDLGAGWTAFGTACGA